MQLFLPGIHGASANQISSAKALAAHLLATVRRRRLSISIGTRYEDISLNKNNFGKKDYRRTGKQRFETNNTARVLIPSLGVNYSINSYASVFAGAHKGFSPPSAGIDQKPESSINLELGTRLNFGRLRAEIIGFYNDYSNMLGSDLAASGGSGTLQQFDVGEALVKGTECIVNYQPIPERFELKTPLQVSYTYTETEMLNSFEENSWGLVFVGDEIPYVNKHSLNFSAGVEYKFIQANVGVRYNGDVRTTPGQGKIADRNKIPEHTIIDASARFRIHKYVSLSVKVINVMNEKYLVSRHPSGLRAGHPFGVFGGVNLSW